MKLAICQYSPTWEKIEDSMNRLDSLLMTLSDNTDIIILPEMTLTGYTMKAEEFAEELDGVCTKYFIDHAKKYRIHIIAGLIEKDGEKVKL